MDEVRDRAIQYVESEFKARLFQASRRLPVLCQHNHRQPLDTRKLIEGDLNPDYNKHVGPTIGLCMYGVNDECWQGTICEDAIDAQICERFTPISRGNVLAQFREDLSNPAWVEERMPSLHELIWVLDEMSPKPRWWVRLWHNIFRTKLEPVLPKSSPSALLDSHTEA